MLAETFVGMVLSVATMLLLSWKWQLGWRRTSAPMLGVAGVAGVIANLVRGPWPTSGAAHVLLIWVLSLTIGLCIVAYRFYRDPERHAPDEPGVIASPADGTVISIRQSSGGQLPISTKHGSVYPLTELTRTALNTEDAVVISIAMSFLDVHVNRAPIAGEVRLVKHFPGLFGSLRRPEMALRNERMTTIIEQGDVQVAVVQIASRLVRQIVSFIKESQTVALGQRIGVIRMGSQVDLVLPVRSGLAVEAHVGQHLRAGETVIARLAAAPPAVAPDPLSPGVPDYV
jgi:phosphatidylserine decarboxylase